MTREVCWCGRRLASESLCDRCLMEQEDAERDYLAWLGGDGDRRDNVENGGVL